MIPIVTTIQQGNNIATAQIGDYSVKVKFNSKSPQFQETVINMLDSFMWSKDPNKDIEQFKIDRFEKSKE